MKIIFDYQIFYLQKIGGISKYFYNLIYNLKIMKLDVLVFAPLSKNAYAKKLIQEKILKGYYVDKYPKFTYRLINNVNLTLSKIFLERLKPNILHITYYNNIYNLKTSIPKVITVYDLIHEKFGNYYKKNFHFKKSILNIADSIICISENTKKDLLDYYKIDEKKISVIYLGVDQNNQHIKKIKKNKNYILYVGDRSKYKNFKNFILAYSRSKILSKNFDIICFGGGKFKKDELGNFNQLNISITQISQIDGDDLLLKSYYFGAEFLIIPSLYEGFGLTLIEAMSLNCPVLCSDSSSLKEIGGEAATFFDPNNYEDIKFSMEKFVAISKKSRSEIIVKGKKNSEKYSWKECANKTIEIYKKLIV